jgi:hypothetical protein
MSGVTSWLDIESDGDLAMEELVALHASQGGG